MSLNLTEDYLTVLDKFSKLGQAIPIKAKTSIDICNALVHYFSFYGLPEKCIFDNGKEFNNETVKELLKIHKINVHFTTPLHHESNSPVERFHSTLLEHLRILRTKHGPDEHLMEYAIIAYNSSIHSSTKFTPFELTLGHTSSRDPQDLIDNSFFTDYAKTHRDKIKGVYEKVSQNSEQNKLKVLAKHNTQGPVQDQYKVGQTVYKSAQKRNKRDNKFKGPFEIIQVLENNKVKVRNKSNSKEEIIHIKELRAPVSVTEPSSA